MDSGLTANVSLIKSWGSNWDSSQAIKYLTFLPVLRKAERAEGRTEKFLRRMIVTSVGSFTGDICQLSKCQMVERMVEILALLDSSSTETETTVLYRLLI
jgi:hypothetical protein